MASNRGRHASHVAVSRTHRRESTSRILFPRQAAYDKVRKAKKQAEERTRRLDDKRKKIKLGEDYLDLTGNGLSVAGVEGAHSYYDSGQAQHRLSKRSQISCLSPQPIPVASWTHALQLTAIVGGLQCVTVDCILCHGVFRGTS